MKKGVMIILSVLLPLVSAYSQEEFDKKVQKVLTTVYKRTHSQAKPWIKEALFVSDAYRYPITLSDAQWQERLTPSQYHVLRKEGTERAFSGEYDKWYEKGTYYSTATGQPLFSSEDKFDSKSGWPSFTRPITDDAVRYKIDSSLWSTRIEVVDSMSGSHLGHVFEDGPAPTQLRYCMNSESLIFVPEGGTPPKIVVAP